eukprot:gene39902-48752_t
MIPISPLDGGRITAVLSPRIWFAGVPVLIALFIYRPNALLIVIAVMALPQLMRAWKYDPNSLENKRYYGIEPSVKATYAFYYLALLTFLILMTHEVHEMLAPVRRNVTAKMLDKVGQEKSFLERVSGNVCVSVTKKIKMIDGKAVPFSLMSVSASLLPSPILLLSLLPHSTRFKLIERFHLTFDFIAQQS